MNKEKTYHSSLSDLEKKEIDEKITFELEHTNYHTLIQMTRAGGLANALAGIFIIWVLYREVNHAVLFYWYSVLILFNIINISWSGFFNYKYKNLTASLLKKWHVGLYLMVAALAVTWGSIGVIFTPATLSYQLFVITFLQVVLLSYAFGAVIDILLAVISICCLLLPTISWQIYLAIAHHSILSLSFAISFLILGTFLLVVCYIVFQSTQKQIALSFLNAALNKKLENMNKFLEYRVKERTRELEDSLKLVSYQATHDLLTNLPNQRLLLKYVETAIKHVNHNKHMFAVSCFYLNELEKINDAFGYRAGDMVIKTIAQRFKKNFSDVMTDDLKKLNYVVTLSRKDIFVILIEPIVDLNEIEQKVRPLFSILDEPVYIGKQNIKMTASIGVSVHPQDGEDDKTLFMNAAIAMLNAKKRGGNTLLIYSSKNRTDLSRQLELESNLHAAIQKNEFILQYQPVVNLKTGQINSVEALIRWHHPVHGIIPPDIFIPLAEANGTIIAIGDWVLRTACKQIKTWHQKGFSNLKMAINLSAKQLQKKNIAHVIDNILKELDLDPNSIELELTESTAFELETVPIIKQFKSMKLCLAIDDFGTGFSGLSNLKLFSIDKLKIDKTFVRDLDSSDDSKAIVKNIIALAKTINVAVLAEGVETEKQLQFLKENGCLLIQGHYFSPAIDADDLLKLLEKTRAEGAIIHSLQ